MKSQKILYGNQKPANNTSCGHRGTHAYVHPSTFFYNVSVFSRTPFLILMLSLFLPLSVSLALPVFRGTWRDIRQGSESDCNSPVHFSAASSEPGSRRWPSWALRSSKSLHRCGFPALLTGTLGREDLTWGCGGSLQLKCGRLKEDKSFLWNGNSCVSEGLYSPPMDRVQVPQSPGILILSLAHVLGFTFWSLLLPSPDLNMSRCGWNYKYLPESSWRANVHSGKCGFLWL